MKIGLLGAGRIGSLHAKTLSQHRAVDTVRIFDPLPSRAEELAASIDAEHAESIEDLMRTCDAILIASSTDSHAADLTMAAKAGLPTFCEKPIAIDLESTDRAIDAVEQAGVPVMMGFNRRFDPGFALAREAVADGTIGDLMLIVGQHHDHRPPPEEYLQVSGGQFKDQLTHDFDLLRFVSGDEVTAVHAGGSPVGVRLVERHGDTAVAVVTLWLRSGAMAALCGARLNPVGYDVRMEVFGTGDSIAVGWDEHTPIRIVDSDEGALADPYREWLPRFGESYRAEIDAFLSMVGGEISSPCTVHDARAALVIAEACRRSIERRGPVELEAV